MKKFLLMLIIFFICGFISADLCMEELQKSSMLLQLEVYENYAKARLAFKDIFWNILYERLKLFGIVGLLCFTPMHEKLAPILMSAFSFIWGFFCMSSIVEIGVAGLVIALIAVMPHGIFYASAVALMIQKHRIYTYRYKERTMKEIGRYVVMLLLFIAGCIVETLVSTHFIPWVIRLSLV